MTRRKRLGWLGPAIVALGAAIAILAGWYILHAQPKVGPIVDTIRVGDHLKIVVRDEDGGDRSFVELYDRDEMKWQALVPHYGGRVDAPGVSVGKVAVTIRVVRDGRAEIFAISRDTAEKLGGMGLGHGHGAIDPTATGPVSITDRLRSYEIVSGTDWHQMVGIELTGGTPLWSVELGPAPVTDAGVDGDQVWVAQGSTRRTFDVRSGKPL